MDAAGPAPVEDRQRRRRGRRGRPRRQPGRQAHLARHEAGRARPVGDHRRALSCRQPRQRQGPQPDRLRRVHRAGAWGRRPAAHLRHVVDPQRRAPVGGPEERAGARDADPEHRQGQQADLAGPQADPAGPVDHGGPALSDGLAGDRQGRAADRLRRVRRAGAGRRRAPAHRWRPRARSSTWATS